MIEKLPRDLIDEKLSAMDVCAFDLGAFHTRCQARGRELQVLGENFSNSVKILQQQKNSQDTKSGTFQRKSPPPALREI